MTHFPRTLIGRLVQRRADDQGFAMITVIATMFVLSIVVLGGLATAMATLPQARRTQNYEAAMAAAKAGVDDYLQRLSADTLYWQNNRKDATNPALVDPTNPATTDNWRTVPGVAIPAGQPADPSAKPGVPQYQYTVLQDFATIRSFGLITLKSTGKVGNTTRTVLVDLRQESFLRYGYFTDFETFDPALYALTGYPAALISKCAGHYWFKTASDPVGRYQATNPTTGAPLCPDPQFNSADVLNGPAHSNDALYLKGYPTFKSSATETSWPATGVTPLPPSSSKIYRTKTAGSAPRSCSGCYAPTYAPAIVLPPYNPGLADAADPAKGGKGCLYTGPTRIRFQPSGGYEVLSPNTTGAMGLPAYCGTFPAAGGQTSPQIVSGPKNGVVYVRALLPGQKAQTAYGGFWPGFPLGPDDTAKDPTFGYSPIVGDAFVEGQVKGQYTLGTDRNITITGDIRYQGGTSGVDTLGLISTQGFVQIYHPVQACEDGSQCVNGFQNIGGPRDVTVDAAIMAVNHSFIVQNYNRGAPLGTLTVVGSIAQRYRGPVAQLAASGTTPTSGYGKNYIYDTRLQIMPPPAYINPANARWQVQNFSEQTRS